MYGVTTRCGVRYLFLYMSASINITRLVTPSVIRKVRVARILSGLLPSGPSSALSRGWRRINPLQQKNPCGVGQGIGGYLELDTAMTQVRCESSHDSIQS